MADEETTTEAGDTAGNAPQLQPIPLVSVPEATSGPIPEIKDENSPFLGKLIVAESAKKTLLNPDAVAGVATPESAPQKTEPVVNTTSPPAVSAATAAAPAADKKINTDDILFGGNIVTLLEEEQNREEGTTPAKTMGDSFTETPQQRSIREIGLAARPDRPALREVEPAPKEEGLPKIRTYAADMSEEIRKRGASLATIINAEREKEEKPKKEVDTNASKRNLFLVSGAGLLVVAGICAVVAVIFLLIPKNIPPPHLSLVPPNQSATVTLTSSSSLAQALADKKNAANLNLGEIEEIKVTDGTKELSAEEILTALGAPAALSRNATDIMIGVHSFNHNQPFILVSVSAYDLTFQAMLSWEKTIGDALGPFFAPDTSAKIPAAPLNFSDRVIQNIDARDSGSPWRIVYAFLRPDLLIITTNESTLKEIQTRRTLSSGN